MHCSALLKDTSHNNEMGLTPEALKLAGNWTFPGLIILTLRLSMFKIEGGCFILFTQCLSG